MKIFEIIPQMTSGGAERFVLDLCNELSKAHDVYLILFFEPSPNAFYLRELNEKVKLITLNKKSGLSFNIFVKIFNLIKEHKPDIVHSHVEAVTYIFPASLLCRNTSFFHTVHSDAYYEAATPMRRILRKVFFSNKFIYPVTISKSSRDSFVKLYKMDAPVIYNGRSLPESIIPSQKVIDEIGKIRKHDTRLIIYSASIHNVKRPVLIAKIAKRLYDEGFRFDLILMGKVSESNRSILSEVYNVEAANVHYIGEKSNPMEYMSLCDAYCLFSELEGLPISLIEALSVPLVPICTPVGGIPEMINKENGFLAEDISEHACYNVFKSYLLTPEREIYKLKENAKISSNNYRMAKCAELYQQLFVTSKENK